MTNRKFKKTAGCLMAVAMMAMMAMPALAGQWQKNAAGWWWQEDNGTYPMNTWCWLDGNRDGIAECYYFNGYGYMLAGTVTPDGYTVNENGAWTVNGIVQTKIVPTTTSGGTSMPTVGGSSGGTTAPGTTTTTQAATTVANGNEIRCHGVCKHIAVLIEVVAICTVITGIDPLPFICVPCRVVAVRTVPPAGVILLPSGCECGRSHCYCHGSPKNKSCCLLKHSSHHGSPPLCILLSCPIRQINVL